MISFSQEIPDQMKRIIGGYASDDDLASMAVLSKRQLKALYPLLMRKKIECMPSNRRHMRLQTHPEDRHLFSPDEFVHLLDMNRFNDVISLLENMDTKEKKKILAIEQELENKILDYQFKKNIKNVIINKYLSYLKGRQHQKFQTLCNRATNKEIKSRLIGQYITLNKDHLPNHIIKILLQDNILPSVARRHA